MKLHERLAQRGYHSSIMTTFGVDFSAYETIVLSRLRAAGCNNNLVIADARMLTHALDTAIELPQQAGRQYSITGARSKGVFHPKVTLQLGRKAGRLFVSSANLTAPGLSGNLEVIGHIAASAENEGECGLLAAAWRYLGRFLDMEEEAVAHQVTWMRQRAAWLMDREPADGLVTLATGEQAAFIEGNGKSSIASRFVDFISGDAVKRLVVISPYWDEDLKALTALQQATDAREVCVLVGGYKPSFPSPTLDKLAGIRLYGLEAGAQNRFVHGKIVIAQTRDADHVLYGSANCTVAALGSVRGFAGLNAEACLYRRMAPRAALEELRLEGALTKEKMLKGSELPTWQVRPEIPLEAAAARSPGRFEAHAGHLLWWPSSAYLVPEGRIELIARDGSLLAVGLLPLDTLTEGCRRFVMSDGEEEVSFARIRIGEHVSALAVVVMTDVLRSEVREGRSRQLDEAASRLNNHEKLGLWVMDVIELIAQAEAVEVGSDSPPSGRASAARKKAVAAPVRDDHKTLSYGEFVAGRKLRSEKTVGSRSEFVASDLSLVRDYLNRLIGHGSPNLRKERPDDEASIRAALEVHDEAEEDEVSDLPETETEAGNNFASPSKGKKARDEEEKRRKVVATRVAARADLAEYSAEFNEDLLERARTKGLAIQDVLRLRAILMVMIGSACPIGTGPVGQEFETQVLRSDGNASWPLLIGKVLATFFGGPQPAIGGLTLSAMHKEPPLELLECLATCFWVLHACRVAARSKKETRGLLKRLDDLSSQVYRRSGLTLDEFSNGPVVAIFEKMSTSFAIGIEPDQLLSMHSDSVKRVGLANDELAEAVERRW
jgi:hypothetical protein